MTTPQRSRSELVDTDDPGIVQIHEWAARATNPVELLPANRAAGERALLALQVTSRSPLGAIALKTGGILVDGGWVRILGSGCSRLPRAIDSWNGLGGALRLPRALLVGDDAVGGFFALNGGGIPGEQEHVFYFAPDSLAWEDVAASYSDWIWKMFTMDLGVFYADARWPSWRNDVAALAGDEAFSIHPFLFAAGPPVAERSRRPVAIDELFGLHVTELPQRLRR
ncbi:MAG TPA: DUF2625 family protein [Xanthomonadales bacterium]|nr:DUF2625 family protein [Xanthomonadales bacterium]